MTRTHRSVHRALWPILALVICVGFLTALVLREPQQIETPAAGQETRK